MFTLGSFQFDNPLVLAPMAGVSDRVFREICTSRGADYAVGEMVGTQAHLRNSNKTKRRLDLNETHGVRIAQIAGAEPSALADAARYAVDQGAHVVDINMGCPAKKVCNKLAGSALMRDEGLVGELLEAVVQAVAVPVSLKMRSGWDLSNRNAPRIACMAEQVGVSLLSVHGRSRACAFKGAVEYDTIAAVKQAVSIPVIANGDICDAERAREVLELTGCDGLMIGRAAFGNPWIFSEIKSVLTGRPRPPRPSFGEVIDTVVAHVASLHDFYGEYTGVRVARKHLAWYAATLPGAKHLRNRFNRIDQAAAQLALLQQYRNEAEGALAA